MAAARRVAEGHFEGKVTVRSHDEIGALGKRPAATILTGPRIIASPANRIPGNTGNDQRIRA